MATVSAYKTVTSSWKSAGPEYRPGGPDGYDALDNLAWPTLALTYTIGSTVTPNATTELAAKNAYFARVGLTERTVRTEAGDPVDLAVYSAGVHAWTNQTVKTAVFRAYAAFNAGLDSSGHMIRIEYDDSTDLIRTIVGPITGVSEVRLSSCTVTEEFDLSDIEGGYGQ